MSDEKNTKNEAYRLKSKATDVAKALDVGPDELCEELGIDDLESVAGGHQCCGTDGACCGTDGGASDDSKISEL